MSNPTHRIVLDTLGKLHAYGHGLFGYCHACDRHFDVPLPALIVARGCRQPAPGDFFLAAPPKAAQAGHETDAPSRQTGRS